MNAREALKVIGQTGTLDTNELSVSITVLDIKSSYGQTRYLVQPVAGSGEVWVNDYRVKVGA